MMQKIQRFGGAMFTPVLLFAFAGISIGFSTLFKNQLIFGELARPDGIWFKVWSVFESGGWTVFAQLPLLFVVGLPIGLAKKQNARAAMEALVLYLMFNYYINAILANWGTSFGVDFAGPVGSGTGLALIAGIKTLDLGMLGAIFLSGLVVYIHDRYFEKELPEFLGIFRGSPLIVALGAIVLIPVALLTVMVWPKVQHGIAHIQVLLVDSGSIGVWFYTFFDRLLIPTGLHHFIYSPFLFDNIAVHGGIVSNWATHLNEFAASHESLRVLFPAGGFALQGMSKVFGAIGIAGAIYVTAKPEKKKDVLGLLIPITITAVMCGVTEPIEYTFLFIAPALFLVHAFLAATLSATVYYFGVSGNFNSGLLEWVSLNWLPLGPAHYSTYIIQVVIGLLFSAIWFLSFKFAIERFNLLTPGRDSSSTEVKFVSKADYRASRGAESKHQQQQDFDTKYQDIANKVLVGLGGKDNVVDVTNCATRLRISVNDPSLVQDNDYFKSIGAHAVVKQKNSIQVIIGTTVPYVRDKLELSIARF